MNAEELTLLLAGVRDNIITLEDAHAKISRLPFDDIGFARIDSHRELRIGFPEVIFCPGKKTDQIIEIAKRQSADGTTVIATRAPMEDYIALKKEIPGAEYFEDARIIAVNRKIDAARTGDVLVITAGTADIPVAEEAAVTAELSGCRVERMFDCGVAGIHRLFAGLDRIHKADVVIVAAGMDGALPSVIGGVAGRPVIAVPTSVGYGAAFGGIAPLLTMLNSCAPGVSVVNIDNGFGAGYLAALICRGYSKK